MLQAKPLLTSLGVVQTLEQVQKSLLSPVSKSIHGLYSPVSDLTECHSDTGKKPKPLSEPGAQIRPWICFRSCLLGEWIRLGPNDSATTRKGVQNRHPGLAHEHRNCRRFACLDGEEVSITSIVIDYFIIWRILRSESVILKIDALIAFVLLTTSLGFVLCLFALAQSGLLHTGYYANCYKPLSLSWGLTLLRRTIQGPSDIHYMSTSQSDP
ncbi:hypothetical protein KC354_g34 [Hortaea werneckii]|nr:hypothetical protein KC354_g34 [Hortaea werneckii]